MFARYYCALEGATVVCAAIPIVAGGVIDVACVLISSFLTRRTLAHSFQSQFTASFPCGPWQKLVSVCMTGNL